MQIVTKKDLISRTPLFKLPLAINVAASDSPRRSGAPFVHRPATRLLRDVRDLV